MPYNALHNHDIYSCTAAPRGISICLSFDVQIQKVFENSEDFFHAFEKGVSLDLAFENLGVIIRPCLVVKLILGLIVL